MRLDDDVYRQHGNTFLEAHNNVDDMVYSMDDFDDVNGTDNPHDLALRIFNGYEWYSKGHGSFNPNHDWFAFDAYANLVSIQDYDLADYFRANIVEDEFYAWCVAEGIVEADDEE